MENKKEMSRKSCKLGNKNSGSGGGPIYFLGLIGAIIYLVQQVNGFWPTILAILKALVWPALVVYELLKSLYS